jgi:hypothetical protein
MTVESSRFRAALDVESASSHDGMTRVQAVLARRKVMRVEVRIWSRVMICEGYEDGYLNGTG